MNELNIPGSQSTPSVSSNLALGQLSLQGDSYPENSFEFFTTVISWIEDFLTQKTRAFALEYHYLESSQHCLFFSQMHSKKITGPINKNAFGMN